MSLRLALPSKGRIQAECIAWFAERGVAIARSGAEREYAGHVEGIDGVDLVLLPAAEIPRELAAGRVHLGVSGIDLVRERVPGWALSLRELARLGFGRADLVIAVPAVWIDVLGVDDLDGVAADFHARHGFRMRIATKYHHLLREFLRRRGIADYRILDSQGATEGAVRDQRAELIADITSTGATLRANHLRILPDGVILQSEAALFAAREAEWSDAARAALAELGARLGVETDPD